jgi:hypothetical protein
MSDSDEAPDWAKKEVQEAIRILKEDGVHIHKTYKAFLDSQHTENEAATGEKLSETGEKLSGDTEGSPPPEKQEEKQEKPKKKGMWWGDRSE